MGIRHEVVPFILIAVFVMAALAFVSRILGMSWMRSCVIYGVLCVILNGYFLYFFRDPERIPPADSDAVLAPADGYVAKITEMREEQYLETDTVRISIFLSLFDVHVNRAPISGKSKFLGYFPGKHFFTFEEKSSDHNQHNAILMTSDRASCLLRQIVGPVCRRVVYWPDHDKEVRLEKGDRIGMMKFGSRFDMYFPVTDIDVTIKEGDVVRAGESIIARLRKDGVK